VTCTGITLIIIAIIIIIIIIIIITFIIRGIVVGLVTSFVLEDTASQSQRGKKLFLLPDTQIETEAHSGSNSICTGSSFAGNKGDQGMKLTTHFKLVPCFTMTGDTL
jgi:uncharacterized membrane protein YqiK